LEMQMCIVQGETLVFCYWCTRGLERGAVERGVNGCSQFRGLGWWLGLPLSILNMPAGITGRCLISAKDRSGRELVEEECRWNDSSLR
jgi:hypothetical protein